MNTLADRLGFALKKQGLKVAEVVKRGGPSRPTIYRIQNDPDYVPESYSLERLAKALGVSVEWMALGIGPMEEHVVRETPLPYRSDDLDLALLGACFAAVLEALERHTTTRPSAAKIGAVMAEVYASCQQEGKEPTPALVEPFLRVLLA